MKFGGTSLGSAERVRAAALRVHERLDRRPLVVVSALAGTTDLLIRGARAALSRDRAAETIVEQILARHRGTIEELFAAGERREALLAHLASIIQELRTLYTGVHYLEELTPRSLDAISAIGGCPRSRRSWRRWARSRSCRRWPSCASSEAA